MLLTFMCSVHLEGRSRIPILSSSRAHRGQAAVRPWDDRQRNRTQVEAAALHAQEPASLKKMLILASASPRRHELLQAAGIEHVVRPAHIPEVQRVGEPATAFVQRLAEEKAQATPALPGEIVLGADTVVCVDKEVFGKPVDDQDAMRMLRRLAGREHWVHTGICLISGNAKIVDLASTKVFFLPLTEDEIQGYTRSGESRDKAGAYAIQGRASKFVSAIEGCYQNVVGLPVSLVYRHLKSL